MSPEVVPADGAKCHKTHLSSRVLAEGYYNHIFLNLHKAKEAEAEVVPRSSLVFSLVKLS